MIDERINFEEMKDHDILVLVAYRVNELLQINETVISHEKRIANCEQISKDNRKMIVGIIMGIIAISSGIIASFLKHIGLR